MLSGLVDAMGVTGKLGIIVAKNQKGEVVIERLVPGGPAAKDATLKTGDIILQIDGKDVPSDTNAVADMLIGPKGSEAIIKIKQNGLLGSSVKQVKLSRGEFADPKQGTEQKPLNSPSKSPKDTATSPSFFGFMSAQGPPENQLLPAQKPKQQQGGEESSSWNLFGDMGAALGLQTAGIGVKLGQKGNKVIVAELMPGGPASKSGKISAGDELLEVDGSPVATSTMEAVGWRLSGAKGSEVKLKLQRSGVFGGETLTVSVVRDDSVSAGNVAVEEKKRAEAKKKADTQRKAEAQSSLADKNQKKANDDDAWNLFGSIGSAASALGLPTCGVGVMLETKGKAVIIDQVIRGGPADKSGRVQKGDQIVAVDAASAEGSSAEWVALKLSGSKGSEVKVKLLRSGLMGQEYVYATLKRDDTPAAAAAAAKKKAESERRAEEEKKRERAKVEGQRKAEEEEKAKAAEQKAKKGGDEWGLFSLVGDAASAVGLPTCSVGVVLGQRGKAVVVAEVIKGGPADKSGRVQKGDEISAVADEAMSGSSAEWVALKLSGPKGSEVKVKLVRSGLMGQEYVYATLKRDDTPAAAAAEAKKKAESERRAEEEKKRERAKVEGQRKAEEEKAKAAEQKAKKGGDEWGLFSLVGDAASAVGLPTCSVGVVLGQRGKAVVVAEVIKGGPADKSGRVQKGDVIREVDGKEVGDSSAEGVGWKLSGSKGSEVKVKLVRSGLMGQEYVYATLKRDDTPAAEAKKTEAKKEQSKTTEGGGGGGGGWSLFLFAGSALGGSSAGVGIKLGKQGKTVVVGSVQPRGAAARSGKVSAGDQILAVDGTVVDGTDLEAVGKRLSGPVGSEVKLKLRQAGFFGAETVEVVLKREESAPVGNAAAEKRAEGKAQAKEKKEEGAGGKKAEGWNVLSIIQECTGQCSAGIGVKLQQKGDMVVVREVLRGAPAQRSGKVQVDDVILEVDGESAAPTPDGVTRQLGGPSGSKLVLRVRRPGVLGPETLDVSLCRENIFVQSAALP